MWDVLLEIFASGFSIRSRGQRIFVGISMALAGTFFLLLAGLLATGQIESAPSRVLVLGISAFLMILSAISFWLVYRAITGRSE